MREAALSRLSRMKDKFNEVFVMDERKAPRTWSPDLDVPAIAKQVRTGDHKSHAILRYTQRCNRHIVTSSLP